MNMIKNLIPQLNSGGLIKIGIKGKQITSQSGTKFRPPKKLDHFQLVTTEKDEDDDYIVDVDLQNKIKESKSGLQDKNGCLVGLPIRLLYNDTELNFPNRLVSYVSGKLSCSGDNEKSTKRIDNFEKVHPCPCSRIEPNYQGKDKCKPSGTLTCIIDEVGFFGQAHKFRTTSMNTIKGILGGIELIKTATGGKIAGLPLMLTMNAKQTTTPGGINTTVYVVSICYRGNLSDLRQEVLQLMTTEKQYMIEMDTMEKKVKANVEIVDDAEEIEFIEEFFPDAVVIDGDKEVEKENENAVSEDNQNNEQEQEEIEEEIKEEIEKKESTIAETLGAIKPKTESKDADLYERFRTETDINAAMALANRLKRAILLHWLLTDCPDKKIEIDAKILKPAILEIIKNVLLVSLASSSPDKEPVEKSIEKPIEKVEEEIKENFIRDHDNSGPIVKDQLRKLVKLKTTLEDQGVLKPEKWVSHVNFFLDADKKEIDKAINLTTVQGDTFIKMLEKNIVKE